jgi:hypothetical protein
MEPVRGIKKTMSSDLPSGAGQEKQGTEINCFSCQHFYITYDKSFPYGCRAAGFKSRLLPSKEMYVNSGMDCLLFAEKDKTR